jgi:hypothetical protein
MVISTGLGSEEIARTPLLQVSHVWAEERKALTEEGSAERHGLP